MNRLHKIVLAGLMMAGIGVWCYDGLLLIGRLSPPGRAAAWTPPPLRRLPAFPTVGDTVRTSYTGGFRDPFEPDFRMPPRSPSTPRPASLRPSVPALPPLPLLTLEGVVWDETDPIATIKGPDGRSENLRVGMTLAGATVTRIDPGSVVLRVGKQTLTLMPSGPRL